MTAPPNDSIANVLAAHLLPLLTTPELAALGTSSKGTRATVGVWRLREVHRAAESTRQLVKRVMVDIASERSMQDLPVGATHLTFTKNFNQSLAVGVLPIRLTHLRFENDLSQPLAAGVLPTRLTHLDCGAPSNFNQQLAAGLTRLGFEVNFNQPLAAGVLTVGLTHLRFRWNFNQSLAATVLKAGLAHLKFDGMFNQQLAAGMLPTGLTHLTVGQSFNRICGERANCWRGAPDI